MVSLIIFDCDGVLVDSEEIASRIEAKILTEYGYPVTTEDNIQNFTGKSFQSIQQHIWEQAEILVPDEVLMKIQAIIMTAFEQELFPLLTSVLNEDLIKQTAKCIASSSPKTRVLKSLDLTKQSHFFQSNHIFTAEQVSNGKPAPDLFLLAAAEMGYPPSDCLVIEDSVVGLKAAQAAGMPAIAFLGGGHTRFPWYHEQIYVETSYIAHTAAELLGIIKTFINIGDQL
ncbi:HAD family hydrolase [Candidatus Odyssella thessalonicensis]|uniref:HAD family hydrolase n=1 Tax=Candidatus Odyssella thessalonicensis TaxID=84647 RepID=UPI000225A8E4|nr:HAD family phosphatase [Candidatus Odyssella thessalonicensis]